MKPLFFFISLLGSSFTALSISIDKLLFGHRYDLKLFLDWCHKYTDVFEIQKQKYMAQINSDEEIVVKALQTYKAQKMSNLLYAATQLRNALVQRDNDYILSNQVEINAETLTAFMSTMPLVLDDLKKNIEEWMNDEQMLRKSLTVMDEKPLKWFKEHGFEESTLNDITLPLLKEKVEELCGDGKAFDSLLSFFGSLHTLISSVDIASKLAWLYTFGNNPKALYSLRKYLTREGSTVPPELTDKIIKSLRKLGDEEGVLNRLFGNGRDGGLYPCIMPILNKAVFFEERGEQYMNVLVEMSADLSIEFGKFERTILLNGIGSTPTKYWEYGFLYDREKLDMNRIFRYIHSLTRGPDKLITNVEYSVTDAIINDERATRIVEGSLLTMPKTLIMAGMLGMGITAV